MLQKISSITAAVEFGPRDELPLKVIQEWALAFQSKKVLFHNSEYPYFHAIPQDLVKEKGLHDYITDQEVENFGLKKLDAYAEEYGGDFAEVLVGFNEETTLGVHKYLQNHPTDLLVLGSKGEKPYERAFLNTKSLNMIRSIDCPMLFSRRENAIKPKNIVLAWDLRQENEDAYLWAKLIAETFKGNLKIISVVTPESFLAHEILDLEKIKDNLAKEYEVLQEAEALAQDALQKLVVSIDLPVRIETRVTLGGHPGKIILSETENNCDLLILGGHNPDHSYQENIGSVRDYLFWKSNSSILMIPEKKVV